MAFKAMKCVSAKKIPNNVSLYFLYSLKRLTDDEEMICKIDNLITQKCNRKKQFYFNPKKGKC